MEEMIWHHERAPRYQGMASSWKVTHFRLFFLSRFPAMLPAILWIRKEEMHEEASALGIMEWRAQRSGVAEWEESWAILLPAPFSQGQGWIEQNRRTTKVMKLTGNWPWEFKSSSCNSPVWSSSYHLQGLGEKDIFAVVRMANILNSRIPRCTVNLKTHRCLKKGTMPEFISRPLNFLSGVHLTFTFLSDEWHWRTKTLILTEILEVRSTFFLLKIGCFCFCLASLFGKET